VVRVPTPFLLLAFFGEALCSLAAWNGPGRYQKLFLKGFGSAPELGIGMRMGVHLHLAKPPGK
jgi:hypothetical protein